MDDLKQSAQQLSSEEWREIEKFKTEDKDIDGDVNGAII